MDDGVELGIEECGIYLFNLLWVSFLS